MQAVRTYFRLMKPKWEARDYAESADAGFDAGEWSGPWHATENEREEAEVQARVIQRTGVSPLAFESALGWCYHTHGQRYEGNFDAYDTQGAPV
jgi:hypothetical protein